MWSGTEDKITCIMIRHGKTASNESGRYLGLRDEVLAEQGKAELLARTKQRCETVDACVVSPLSRCMETAELLWPGSRQLVIEEFREIDFGAWDGMHYSELMNDPLYQQWIDSRGEAPFPQGEKKSDYILRVWKGWEKLLVLLQTDPAWERVHTLGFVVHGGTIMALFSRLLDGDYFDYQVSCGDGFQFVLERATGEVKEVKRLV